MEDSVRRRSLGAVRSGLSAESRRRQPPQPAAAARAAHLRGIHRAQAHLRRHHRREGGRPRRRSRATEMETDRHPTGGLELQARARASPRNRSASMSTAARDCRARSSIPGTSIPRPAIPASSSHTASTLWPSVSRNMRRSSPSAAWSRWRSTTRAMASPTPARTSFCCWSPIRRRTRNPVTVKRSPGPHQAHQSQQRRRAEGLPRSDLLSCRASPASIPTASVRGRPPMAARCRPRLSEPTAASRPP